MPARDEATTPAEPSLGTAVTNSARDAVRPTRAEQRAEGEFRTAGATARERDPATGRFRAVGPNAETGAFSAGDVQDALRRADLAEAKAAVAGRWPRAVTASVITVAVLVFLAFLAYLFVTHAAVFGFGA